MSSCTHTHAHTHQFSAGRPWQPPVHTRSSVSSNRTSKKHQSSTIRVCLHKTSSVLCKCAATSLWLGLMPRIEAPRASKRATSSSKQREVWSTEVEAARSVHPYTRLAHNGSNVCACIQVCWVVSRLKGSRNMWHPKEMQCSAVGALGCAIGRDSDVVPHHKRWLSRV